MRPTNLNQFIGQEGIKKGLEVGIKSALIRGQSLPHTLFIGSAGTGKTTLANVIANELRTPFVSIVGGAIEELESLVKVLTRLQKNSILFIDEIHSLSSKMEEVLYQAMEDKTLSIIYEDGDESTIKIADFTLVGATTHLGKLSKPLKSRFTSTYRLSGYNGRELHKIVALHATGLKIDISDEGCDMISKSCRNTPRLAVNLLINARDNMIVRGGLKVTKQDVRNTLDNLDINKIGLNKIDLQILKNLKEYKKMGLSSLASSVNEDTKTLEDEIEPYLLELGFIIRSTGGRMLTIKGLNYVR